MTTQVLIAKDLTLTPSPANPSELKEGELRAFEVAGSVIDNVNASANEDKLMYFALGSADGEPAVVSKHFYGSDISNYKKEAFAAGQVQITTIGFNGSTGSLAVASATGGSIKLIDVSQGYEPFKRITVDVVNRGTPLASAERAAALLNLNTKVPVYVEVTLDAASAQLVDDTTGADVVFSVTRGSSVVTATVSSGEEIKDLVVGEYIRFGHATEKVHPVYKVAAIADGSGTSQEVTLETAYQGETAASVDAGRVSISDIMTGAGIKVWGSATTQSIQTAAAGDFAGVTVTANQAPEGISGADSAKIAELERKNFGTFGFYETNYFPQTPSSRVEPGVDYALYWLHLKNDNDRSVLRENQVSRVCIALDNTASNENILPVIS